MLRFFDPVSFAWFCISIYYFLFGLGRYSLLELPGRMKAIFCGNLDYDARQSDVERLFRRYGRIDRVDMKSG